MPVVIGHAKVTLCFTASAARSSLIVASLPRGTCFINASTSSGAGMTIVPSPQRLLILPTTSPTLGNPLLSVNFSRHDFLFFILKVSDDFYFDIRALGQPSDLNRGARRKIG